MLLGSVSQPIYYVSIIYIKSKTKSRYLIVFFLVLFCMKLIHLPDINSGSYRRGEILLIAKYRRKIYVEQNNLFVDP